VVHGRGGGASVASMQPCLGVLATVGQLLLQQPCRRVPHGVHALQGPVNFQTAPAAVPEVRQLQCSLVTAAMLCSGGR
jgi:hypothetical protein